MQVVRHLPLLAILSVCTAYAAVDIDFAAADVNDDAFVSAAELRSTGLFEAHDLDGDGSLDSDQLGNPELFAVWDADGSGFIERREFYDGIMTFADINGDNRLGSLEFQRALVEWEAGEPVERQR